MMRRRRPACRLGTLGLAALLAAACTAPPPDVPRLSVADIHAQIDAIDEALAGDAPVTWNGAAPNLIGTVTPGDLYDDPRGRHCRAVDLALSDGSDSYGRRERFCRTDAGTWMPDLPPGAGGGGVGAAAAPSPPTTESERDLRDRIGNAERRLRRRYDSHHERRHELNKQFTPAERARASRSN